jgi:hypothetical protein
MSLMGENPIILYDLNLSFKQASIEHVGHYIITLEILDG